MFIVDARTLVVCLTVAILGSQAYSSSLDGQQDHEFYADTKVFRPAPPSLTTVPVIKL